MKKRITIPDEQPITNDTLIEGCYKVQKIIVEKAEADERPLSRKELKIILALTRCIKDLGNGKNRPDTDEIIIMERKDRDF